MKKKTGKSIARILLALALLAALGLATGCGGSDLDGTWVSGGDTFTFSGSNVTRSNVTVPGWFDSHLVEGVEELTIKTHGTFSLNQAGDRIEFVWTREEMFRGYDAMELLSSKELSPARVNVWSISRTDNTISAGPFGFFVRQ